MTSDQWPSCCGALPDFHGVLSLTHILSASTELKKTQATGNVKALIAPVRHSIPESSLMKNFNDLC
jgi:hypothetical protein